MVDLAKVRKLLNLTGSPDDAEALSALRMAQKLLSQNLGDYLAADDEADTQLLLEAEMARSARLKQDLDHKEKDQRSAQRKNDQLKRQVKQLEAQVETLEDALEKATKVQQTSDLERAYQELETAFDREVEKNARLRDQMDQRDRALKKSQRELMKRDRDQDSDSRR